jgi:hypothetical protein
MKDNFTKQFCITVVLLLGLLFVILLPDSMGHTETRRRLGTVLQEMQNGDLNREDFDALAANYYEGLRQDNRPAGLPKESEEILVRSDFLQYSFKPNLNRQYAGGMRITNSFGMPNPEYSYQKPPHTRRIALMGDSLSVGPYGLNYVALLEDRLNQAQLTPEIQRFQILNFSCLGYNILQMMDRALEEAPKFHPDVYMVALTTLHANKKGGWAGHLARLELNRADLKYDFLRRVVAQAGLKPTDHGATITRKLAPFFLEVTEWALKQIKDQASSQGAQMVIILVPPPTKPEIVAAEFDDMRPAVDSVGVPVIDLRDSFRSMKLDDLQIRPRLDIHPNARANEILCENLYHKIMQDPEFYAALVGTDGLESAQEPLAGPQSQKATELRRPTNKTRSVQDQNRP